MTDMIKPLPHRRALCQNASARNKNLRKKQTAAGTSVPAALAQHPPAQHGRAAKHSSPGVGRLYGRAQKDRFRSCKARQTGDRAPLFRPPSRAGIRSPGTSPRQIPSFAGSRNHPFTSFVVFQRQYTMPAPARQAPAGEKKGQKSKALDGTRALPWLEKNIIGRSLGRKR